MKRKIHGRRKQNAGKLVLFGGILGAIYLLLALVPALYQVGVAFGSQVGRMLCRTVLMEEKPVLRYLYYEEEKRDIFRFFSNQLLGKRGQLICAAMDSEEIRPVFEPVVEADELLVAERALLEGILQENQEEQIGYLKISYAERGNIPQKQEPVEEQLAQGDEGEQEEQEPESQTAAVITKPLADVEALLAQNYPLETLSTANALLSEYYIVDSITSTLPELFQAEELLSQDLGVEKKTEGYQVLIYHTHGTEAFCDSRSGEVMDTVRGPGEALAEYLRERGYTVYHDMTPYDWKDGKDNRNYAYSTARPAIEAFLAEHPETEIIIDLHRDSGAKRVAEVDGKQTAKVMLFNGLCRNASGPIDYLDNPNLSTNLAFSLQVNLVGRVLYPGLMHKIYLKNYRYNQHFCGRYLLIELGTEQNTVEEAYNAMEPLAEVLDVVLSR